MTDSHRADEFSPEVTDAIKQAFVVEESDDDDDEIEIDLDDLKLNTNAGLGTITFTGDGPGLPTGKTIRVRHLYFNFGRLWTTVKTLGEGLAKVPANPVALVWHLISLVKSLGDNATIVLGELEAPIVYVLASHYRFEEPVNEDDLFARISLFMKERKAGTPDRGAFARANTNLSKLGVTKIEAGSIVLAERIRIKRL